MGEWGWDSWVSGGWEMSWMSVEGDFTSTFPNKNTKHRVHQSPVKPRNTSSGKKNRVHQLASQVWDSGS